MMPQYQTTTLWFLLTLGDGDILNVRTITASRMTALESMLNNAENDIDHRNKWYKLMRYDYFGDAAIGPGSTLWVVFDLIAESAVLEDLKLVGVYATHGDIPQFVHENDDDYWIDDVTLV
jgi:hypothetical protein